MNRKTFLQSISAVFAVGLSKVKGEEKGTPALNVDTLDGKHSVYYQKPSEIRLNGNDLCIAFTVKKGAKEKFK